MSIPRIADSLNTDRIAIRPQPQSAQEHHSNLCVVTSMSMDIFIALHTNDHTRIAEVHFWLMASTNHSLIQIPSLSSFSLSLYGMHHQTGNYYCQDFLPRWTTIQQREHVIMSERRAFLRSSIGLAAPVSQRHTNVNSNTGQDWLSTQGWTITFWILFPQYWSLFFPLMPQYFWRYIISIHTHISQCIRSYSISIFLDEQIVTLQPVRFGTSSMIAFFLPLLATYAAQEIAWVIFAYGIRAIEIAFLLKGLMSSWEKRGKEYWISTCINRHHSSPLSEICSSCIKKKKRKEKGELEREREQNIMDCKEEEGETTHICLDGFSKFSFNSLMA